jgi:hypothetical protein
MPDDVEKWFTDLEYGRDWQDFDLILAKPSLLSRLQNYLADPNGSDEKKSIVVSALIELLSDVRQNPKEGQKGVADSIKATIQEHSEIAEAAIPELGLIQGITVQRLLGLPVPPGLPQWALDAAAENCK